MSGGVRAIRWILACALLLAGCPGADDDFSTPPGDDDVSGDDDDDVTGDDDDSAAGDPITEVDDLDRVWDCEADEGLCEQVGDCWRDYLDVPALAGDHATPISGDELDLLCRATHEGQVYPGPFSDHELIDGIIDGAGIRFLLDGLDERPLTVTTIDVVPHFDHLETHLLFTDPYVGTFFGVLLTPLTGAPYPGIVAIHGHCEWGGLYLDTNHGPEYPRAGYAVLALSMRANEFAEPEFEVTELLLRNSLTLAGLRMYETLLAARYLAHRDDVDGDRLGLIGHSGGSIISNLTVHVSDRFDAYVWDLDDTYECCGSDASAPLVYPYHPFINAWTAQQATVLQIEYGDTTRPDGIARVLEFYGDTL